MTLSLALSEITLANLSADAANRRPARLFDESFRRCPNLGYKLIVIANLSPTLGLSGGDQGMKDADAGIGAGKMLAYQGLNSRRKTIVEGRRRARVRDLSRCQ